MKKNEIFQDGLENTRQRLGDEAREYDLVLGGLAHVLQQNSTLVPIPSCRDFAHELSRQFHDPLCMSGMSKLPLDQIVAAMIATTRRSRGDYHIDQVLANRLPYAFSAAWSNDEYGLRSAIQEMERDLSPDGAVYTTLDRARGWEEMLCRRIQIIEALDGSEVPDLVELREQATRVQDAAAAVERRAKDSLAKARTRLEELPKQRAREIEPLSALRTNVRKAWNGTVSEPGIDFISDSTIILRADAVSSKRAQDLYARVDETRESPLVGEERMRGFWDRLVESLSCQVHILGWREVRDGYKCAYVVPALEVDSDEIRYLDADRAACIIEWTKATEVMTDDKFSVFAFYRDGCPVAILSPIKIVEVAIDIAEARRIWKERTTKQEETSARDARLDTRGN